MRRPSGDDLPPQLAELMLTTMLHATEGRIRSYRLVADAVALDPAVD